MSSTRESLESNVNRSACFDIYNIISFPFVIEHKINYNYLLECKILIIHRLLN